MLNLRIEQDTDLAESPRDWDNLGTMVCFYKQYKLGDHHDFRHEDYKGWAQLEGSLYRHHDAAVVLPLYLYDHSGITMRTYPFECRWDSGQIGFIYVTKAKLRQEFNRKYVTARLEDKVTGILKSEVETYDQYLTGDVYGFVIEDEKGDVKYSCGGFYGADHCREEGEAMLKFLNEEKENG